MRSLSPSTIKTSCVLLQSVRKFKKCRQKKPYVSFGCEMPLALTCLVIDCIMLLLKAIGSCVSREKLHHAMGWEYLFECTLTERGNFQPLKPCVLLSS